MTGGLGSSTGAELIMRLHALECDLDEDIARRGYDDELSDCSDLIGAFLSTMISCDTTILNNNDGSMENTDVQKGL